MFTLSNLKNTSRPKQQIQRVGRGNGSKRGKTCCRGSKGDKARSGYKRRFGREGGQLPLYRRIPTRGFTNAKFKSKIFTLNLSDVQDLFNEGDQVNIEVLIHRGIATQAYTGGLKILSMGNLTKKVDIEAVAISAQAQEKLKQNKISFKLLNAE
ncbi:MAG: 50S ribosomal protein L15 [Chlamydiia bacterium]|jgi:large subunit ribosomal protein L15|nr:50S ribosomal protein L15 [Chlamydiia bacterium]